MRKVVISGMVGNGLEWYDFALYGQFAPLIARLGAYMGPVSAVLVELFPTAVRNTGMAVSYNIAAAMFGGTAPIVATWLINVTGSKTVIAFYIMACAALTLWALRSFRDRFRDGLE